MTATPHRRAHRASRRVRCHVATWLGLAAPLAGGAAPSADPQRQEPIDVLRGLAEPGLTQASGQGDPPGDLQASIATIRPWRAP